MKRGLPWLLCACLLLGGCTSERFESMEQVNESNQESQQKDVVGDEFFLGERNNPSIMPVNLTSEYEKAAFFVDQVYALNQKSTLVSPMSLDMALGLAVEGCSGETADELYTYLGNENYATWAAQYMEATEGLTQKNDGFFASDNYSFQYILANSIWVNNKDKLNSDYQKRMKDIFRAEVQSVDFSKDKEKTADLINAWCNKKTNGLIPKMVSSDKLTDTLSVILMNSVYFESPWLDKWQVMEHTFKNLAGQETTQDMLSDMWSCYYENEFATAFSKDYYQGFQFIGILPKEEGDFKVTDLNLESLLATKTCDYDVKAIAPKLNFETTAKNIVEILQAQGVNQVFDEHTSNMDRLVELKQGETAYISDILQKCKIELDEEGTKAAAVTAIFVNKATCIEVKPKEMKEVYLDRPFAFIIYDSVRDKIVFIGKVTEL